MTGSRLTQLDWLVQSRFDNFFFLEKGSMLLFRVSNKLGDPLNPANPPVSDPPPLDPTTSTVEHGFQTH